MRTDKEPEITRRQRERSNSRGRDGGRSKLQQVNGPMHGMMTPSSRPDYLASILCHLLLQWT
eukprot:27645-Eustigmatos_ZCMA.PRE.1